MKILSSILLNFLFLTPFAFSQNSVESAVNSFAGKAGMEHASISIHVIDLSYGSIVAKYDHERTLPPHRQPNYFPREPLWIF